MGFLSNKIRITQIGGNRRTLLKMMVKKKTWLPVDFPLTNPLRGGALGILSQEPGENGDVINTNQEWRSYDINDIVKSGDWTKKDDGSRLQNWDLSERIGMLTRMWVNKYGISSTRMSTCKGTPFLVHHRIENGPYFA